MIVDRSAGVCVVRDCVDVVLLLCAHYLRMGLGRLVIIDDGSSDGTFEKLEALSAATAERVEVRRNVSPCNNQPDLFTDTVNALIADGFRFILPFDGDEFWRLDPARIARLTAHGTPGVMTGRWVNFVQSRAQAFPTPTSLFAATWRVAARDADREAVTGLKRAFVEVCESKIALWSDQPVRISRGQHHLTAGPEAAFGWDCEIFHLPLRHKSELTKRALNYEPRRAPVRSVPIESWQSSFHLRMVLDGKTDLLWAANSADARGRLDVYGRPVQLVRDWRLRRLLMRAAAHLVARYRLSPF